MTLEEVEDFEAWYRATAPRLVATLTVVAGDADLGQEASAEACTRALERWERVGVLESPDAWAYRVGVNVLRRRWRRAELERRALSRRPNPDKAPPSIAPEIWTAVRVLPLRQRQAVALRYLLDLTQQEVAEAMGITPGTVAATLVAARRRLATLVDDAEITEVTHHG